MPAVGGWGGGGQGLAGGGDGGLPTWACVVTSTVRFMPDVSAPVVLFLCPSWFPSKRYTSFVSPLRDIFRFCLLYLPVRSCGFSVKIARRSNVNSNAHLMLYGGNYSTG